MIDALGWSLDNDMTANPFDWVYTLNRICKDLKIPFKMLVGNLKWNINKARDFVWYTGDIVFSYNKIRFEFKNITFQTRQLNPDNIYRDLRWFKERMEKEGWLK